MSSTNSITQPSDNDSGMSGNQTESPILRWQDSVLPLAAHHQYPERTFDIELGSQIDAAKLGLLALNMTRSEEPNTTIENSDQQISHSNAIQPENSQVNHISKREKDDLRATVTTVAGAAIGVSVAGIFGIGQLFRGKQVTRCSSLCLLTASLLLMFASFMTGMFLIVFSRTQRSFQSMFRIIQFLLWSAAVSTTLGILMVALYIGLEGL